MFFCVIGFDSYITLFFYNDWQSQLLNMFPLSGVSIAFLLCQKYINYSKVLFYFFVN